MTEQDLPTYSRGDTVRLPVELRDKTGVGYCFAHFYPVEDSAASMANPIEVSGDGKGAKEALLELTKTLTSEKPGVWQCASIVVRDTIGNRNMIEEFAEPILLRVADDPGADYDAPELVSIRDLAR